MLWRSQTTQQVCRSSSKSHSRGRAAEVEKGGLKSAIAQKMSGLLSLASLRNPRNLGDAVKDRGRSEKRNKDALGKSKRSNSVSQGSKGDVAAAGGAFSRRAQEAQRGPNVPVPKSRAALSVTTTAGPEEISLQNAIGGYPVVFGPHYGIVRRYRALTTGCRSSWQAHLDWLAVC